MEIILISIILIHGFIHIIGFVKSFGLAEVKELTLPFSRVWGIIWFITAFILIVSGVLLLLNISAWWIPAITGTILSQVTVFAFWKDARFGSIPNMIILLMIISFFTRYTPPVSMISDEITTASYEERYGSAGNDFFSHIMNPFEISIIPMERLLLVNIENDPDSIYIGFEPQVFDDEITGTGMLVIAWRSDGMVDVYHQSTLSPDPDGYDIVGQGLNNMVAREMKEAILEINDQGAQAAVSFEDIYGRLIGIKLTENSTRPRRPFGPLAPMGLAAENPSAMPLILLHDFYFVRRNNTELSVTINGRNHAPDMLPLPIDFSRMTFARYCPDPLIATLNPAFDGILKSFPWNENLTVHHDDHIVELALNQNVPEIRKISRIHGQHTISMAFSPAFPNPEVFEGEFSEGRFEISGDVSTGFIRGEYKVMRSGDSLVIEMIPTEGWVPNESKLSLRFLYTVEPMFRQWPTTYRWSAEIKQDDDASFRMRSNWERIHVDESD